MSALNNFIAENARAAQPAPSVPPAGPPIPAPTATPPVPAKEVVTVGWFGSFSRWWILGLVGLGIGVAGYLVYQYRRKQKIMQSIMRGEPAPMKADEPPPRKERKRQPPRGEDRSVVTEPPAPSADEADVAREAPLPPAARPALRRTAAP